MKRRINNLYLYLGFVLVFVFRVTDPYSENTNVWAVEKNPNSVDNR